MVNKKFKPSDKLAIRDWDIYYKNFIASVTSEKDESEAEKKKRIARLESNFEDWKIYYFPKYCYAPPAPFHKQSAKRKLANPEWTEADAWARELAKDVVEMMITIYQTLTGIKKSIMLISNSWDSASELLQPYKINLESNERIINDYGIQQMPGSWARGDFTTTQGVSWLAVGAGQNPRGTRAEEVRPDKIIISDIDTDEDCQNPETIKKRWNWYEKAVYPTRSVSKPFQVTWLNNIIAKDSCMVRAMKMADYVSVVNLEDKNGNSTWPAKNKPEHIQRIKNAISTAAYQSEYMNNPLSEGDIFKEMTWGKCPPLRSMPFVVNYADPATSNEDKPKSGVSFKAQFIIGYKDGKYYIYHGFLQQVVQDDFVQWFWDQEAWVNKKTHVYHYIENNSLQNPFYQQVTRPAIAQKCKESGTISISPDERSKPKKPVRIEGNLEPLNRRGELILNEAEKNNPHMIRLEEQFKLFTMQLGSPADGPDCIEGGKFIVDEKNAAMADDSYKSWGTPRNKHRI